MDTNNSKKLLPEKVLRRHSELISELLPDFTRLVIEEGRPADTLLNTYLRIHKEMGSRDRRFLSQAIFSYFRWYGWTVKKLKLGAPEACLLGVAMDVEELPQSFVFLETRCALPFKVEPLGSVPLAEKAARLNQMFNNTEGAERLDLSDLVLADFGAVVDPDNALGCIERVQQRPPTWIRSRNDAKELLNVLKERDIPFQTHEQVTSAIAVEGGVSLAHVLSAQTSQFVVQDIASQCVGLISAPQKGGDWWDCCSGAGGKTLHLMDLMQQDGKVLATDIRIPALKELKKRARRYGIKHIRTQQFNAVHDEPFKKVFDGVLVDAPCSGWGTWSRNPDARWRSSKRDVMQCATRQLKILDNAKWCVKPGGTLLYAVCTFTRPETEEVVMNFLDHHADFKLEPFINPLNGEQTDGQLQIWPADANGDGMFIARFVRNTD